MSTVLPRLSKILPPSFSAYSTLPFVDIAGRTRDSVYIATSSTNVIRYESGSIKVIAVTDGIPGIVNSVGMEGGTIYNNFIVPYILMIGTNTGFRYYNTDIGKIIPRTDAGGSAVYEATYRTELFKDSSGSKINFDGPDTIQYQPITYKFNNFTEASAFLFEGGKFFGYDIHTAETIYDAMYEPVYTFTNTFWGNDNGMYQNFTNYSYTPAFYLGQYFLKGIKVNKITNIYGLTSLGDGDENEIPGLIRQNLLVGTDDGLYFSSSLYADGEIPIPKISMFHDDELGNIVINDICVNSAKLSRPICENGAWLAANDGIYYVVPDYSLSLNSQQMKALTFKGQAASVSNLEICGGPATIVANSSYTNAMISWYKDGVVVPGENKSTLAVTAAGDYNAVFYDPCSALGSQSNRLTVTVITGPKFIFNYPPVIQNCNTNPVTLTVTGDPSYQYRWYTNGVLNGNTTQSFIATQSGQYYVEVSACSNSWVSSSMVQVSLVNLPVPAITGDKPTYCQGDAATLSAGVPLDRSYTINWYKDNVLLSTYQNFPTIPATDPGSYTVTLTATGSTCTQSSVAFPLSFTPPPTFTFNYPASVSYCAGSVAVLQVQGNAAYQYKWYNNAAPIAGATTNQLSVTQNGTYSVQISACPGSWVPSSTVQVSFIQTPVPVITTDKPAYCVGDNATLSLNVILAPTYTINWYRDNVLLPQFNGYFSITTNVPGTYTAAVVGTTADANGNICSSLSAPVVIGFDPAQVISIQQTANNGLCEEQSVTLKAIYNSGTIQWSTGETTDEINVTASGTYSVTLITTSGCTGTSSQTVNFFPLPTLNIPGAAVCFYKNETATLTAPAGFALYNWDNKSSAQTYQVTKPGTVTLTVTDANGCEATQKIIVTDLCPEVEIPNTFTPNGDNINDTWVIQGLDETASVQIFNRYGTLLYKSTGYTTPWDGTYHGKKVPSGAYYYIITTKSGNKKYSGSLMVIF